jgi:hypothetical protein
LVPEKVDGRIETKERKVKGPVSFIETTTKAHLHTENENRCFDVFVDETEGQTRKIFMVQNRNFVGLVNQPAALLRLNLWQNAQRLLESLPVVIDFAPYIRFPAKPLRVRRDRPRFMALIEASALLHQYQRSRRTIRGVPHIVADLDDYEDVRELSAAILGRVLAGVTPSCQKMVAAMSEFAGEFKQTDIEDEMKWSRPTAIKYAKEAVSLGCFEVVEGGKGKMYKYRFIRLADSVNVSLPTRDEVQEYIERFQRWGLGRQEMGNL